MVDAIKLETQERTKFGKGAARQLRREDLIPAVVYGHGGETSHIVLPGHETFLAVRTANALLDVQIDGKSQITLVKDVQRNPVTRIIEHIDLLAIKKGETVEVTVPITVTGESASGTVVTVEMLQLVITAPVFSIPENIEVDVEGKEEGTQIRVGDLALPNEVTTAVDPEDVVVSVNLPIVDEELEAADAEAAEAAAEEASDDADAEGAEDSESEESGDEGSSEE